MLSITAGDIITLLFAELQSKSFGAPIQRMSLEEFLEQFSEDEENEKVAADYYPLSSNIVMFQRSEILVEG